MPLKDAHVANARPGSGKRRKVACDEWAKEPAADKAGSQSDIGGNASSVSGRQQQTQSSEDEPVLVGVGHAPKRAHPASSPSNSIPPRAQATARRVQQASQGINSAVGHDGPGLASLLELLRTAEAAKARVPDGRAGRASANAFQAGSQAGKKHAATQAEASPTHDAKRRRFTPVAASQPESRPLADGAAQNRAHSQQVPRPANPVEPPEGPQDPATQQQPPSAGIKTQHAAGGSAGEDRGSKDAQVPRPQVTLSQITVVQKNKTLQLGFVWPFPGFC